MIHVQEKTCDRHTIGTAPVTHCTRHLREQQTSTAHDDDAPPKSHRVDQTIRMMTCLLRQSVAAQFGNAPEKTKGVPTSASSTGLFTIMGSGDSDCSGQIPPGIDDETANSERLDEGSSQVRHTL